MLRVTPDGPETWRRYRADDLSIFMARVLVHYGLSAPDASAGAECLIDADLSGIDTHGIANFVSHWHYAPGLEAGAVNPRPQVEVLHETAASATLASDRGFGPVVARQAMALAMAKAEQVGVGSVAVRDGCHFGAAGYFAGQAANAGMVAMVVCPTLPSAVPPGGADVGSSARTPWPSPRRWPAAIPSCSTWRRPPPPGRSSSTRGQRRQEPIPLGWAVDGEGRPTTDADAAQAGGLLPPAPPTALATRDSASPSSSTSWAACCRAPGPAPSAPTAPSGDRGTSCPPGPSAASSLSGDVRRHDGSHGDDDRTQPTSAGGRPGDHARRPAGWPPEPSAGSAASRSIWPWSTPATSWPGVGATSFPRPLA